MAYTYTTRKHLPYPSASAKVSALPQDLHELGLEEERINEGHQDLMQPGIVNYTDWVRSTAPSVNSSGEVSTGDTIGGAVWVPDPVISGALMRCVHAQAVFPATALPSPPADGKWKCYAIEAKGTYWGGEVTLSLKGGTEQANSEAALANPPARDSDKAQVLIFQVEKISAGNYAVSFFGNVSDRYKSSVSSQPTGAQSTSGPELGVSPLAENTETEPSKTRPTIVQLSATTGVGTDTIVNVYIGSVQVVPAEVIRMMEKWTAVFAFVVPAGGKWKWVKGAGAGTAPITVSAVYTRL